MTANTYSTWPFGPCRVIARPGAPELRVSASIDALVKQYVVVYDELAVETHYGTRPGKPVDPSHYDMLREVGYNVGAVREVLVADGKTDHACWLSKLTCLPSAEVP